MWKQPITYRRIRTDGFSCMYHPAASWNVCDDVFNNERRRSYSLFRIWLISISCGSLACQSGTWNKQSKSSYYDTFNRDYIEQYGCASSSSKRCAVRTYTFDIKTPTLIMAQLYVYQMHATAVPAIATNVGRCAENIGQAGNSSSAAAVTCLLNLEPGIHIVEFSTQWEGTITEFNGAIIAWPL